MEKLLTAGQLAKELGVSRWTIRNWRLAGLPGYLFGTYYRYKKDEVEEWLKNKKRQVK